MPINYDPWLVALSVVVAVMVSFTSLRLAARVAHSAGVVARIWLLLGAVSMGVGIWAMHFIGMLAMMLPIKLQYDIGLTVGSLLVAIVTSGFAIQVASRPRLGAARHLACSVVMAAGIAGMHYLGMSAIQISPAIHYDTPLVLASMAIALLASYAALGLAFGLREYNASLRFMAGLAASVLMGLAIAGMHYTGMAASGFQPGAMCSGGTDFNERWLSVAVGLAAVGVLTVALVTSIFDVHLAGRARQHAAHLQEVNALLSHQARHDSLTGLPNRSLFIDRLSEAIDGTAGNGRPIVVMLIDLDRFKAINDSIGHQAGDAMLVAVAKRLREWLPEVAVVARLGGDSFLAMVPVDEARQAVSLVDDLVRSIAAPFSLDGLELQVGASVGITTYPFDNCRPEVLISHADEAMYQAKGAGGNGYRFFVPGTTTYSMDRLKLETELRHAAELGQLRLHYQPQVDMRTGRIIGLEALVRWQHPERGWIPPGEFIPMAEMSDTIEVIGRWVLAESCRQSSAWRKQGLPEIPVAINLSAREFRQPGLLEYVQREVAASGLEPRHIAIELTESLVMAEGDHSVEMLEALHGAGFRIALDDFGTGYSSMSYLKRLPVAKLKIDRSFIVDLGTSTESDSIVKAVISLAHALGITVIAEGVETAWQLSALEAFGCDQYQGYWFSRPCSAEELTPLLRKRPRPAGAGLQVANTILGVAL